MVDVKNKSQIEKINDSCENYKYSYNSGNSKFNKLGNWLEKESAIFKNEGNKYNKKYPKFKRGEIVKVDFGINIGTELSNTHYAIVLNSDDTFNNDNVFVIPITSKNGYKRIPLGKLLLEAMPNTNKYNLESYGFLTQIRTVSKARIYKKSFKYICSNSILDKIDKEIISFLTK